MSNNHVELSPQVIKGADYISIIRDIRLGLARLSLHKDSIVQMIEGGDSSSAANFAKVVDQYGVQGDDQSAKNTAAKKMFDEMNSALGNIHASLPQFLSIMG